MVASGSSAYTHAACRISAIITRSSELSEQIRCFILCISLDAISSQGIEDIVALAAVPLCTMKVTQDRSKYLSELSLPAEASALTLWHRCVIWLNRA